MKLRLITAAAALAIVVPILFWGEVVGLQVLCIAAAALALWEYGALRTPPAGASSRLLAILLAALPIVAAGASTKTVVAHTGILSSAVVMVGPPREAWV